MISATTAFSVLLIGFLGSSHCVGMCGGIISALTMGLPKKISSNFLQLIPYLLLYNLGRISSYAIAGAIAGYLGGRVFSMDDTGIAILVSRWMSAFFMLGVGLYLLGIPQLLLPLERVGAKFWKLLQPIGNHFLPVHSPLHAFGLGLVWGWLPCGLVYSVLIMAVALGDPLKGASVMVMFGIGTLPTVLLIGSIAGKARNLIGHRWFRQSAGFIILCFGGLVALTNISMGSDPETLLKSSFCVIPFLN